MKRSSKHITNDDQNAFLMTSADEYIHLWEVEKHPFDQQLQNVDQQKIRILQDNEIKLKEVMSLHFGPIEQFGYGVTPCSLTGAGLQLPPPPVCSKHADVAADGQQATNFGGERNPLNIIYVFDASYCPASGLLGVALSDGSLRVINGRGTCVSILNLPGGNSHLTALAWDYTGSRLATTVATGHLITWGLDLTNEQGGREESIVATCLSIYEGGHQAMRPLFGARFVSSCGEDDQDEKLLISWGVDGRLCLWDSYAQGNIYAPIAVLKSDVQYPIYAVDVSGRHIAVGGGSDGGFIGNPMYLYEIPSS
jgi:WD40 repeat protein